MWSFVVHSTFRLMAREIARGPVYLHKRSSCIPEPNLIGGSHLTILAFAGNFSTRHRPASSMRMTGWLNKDLRERGVFINQIFEDVRQNGGATSSCIEECFASVACGQMTHLYHRYWSYSGGDVTLP